MRVAIIHDWLTVVGGGEKVLAELLGLFPEADLFSLVCFLEEHDRHILRGRIPKTTFIQRLPFARKNYRAYLPLMPLAIEQFDLSGYDLIISSSHAVAKGVITSGEQLHISYVHSPIRYAWELQAQYLREARLERGLRSALARIILHYIRLWDHRTAHGVDRFVANSAFIERRIRKTYRRESDVIHPPVDVQRFQPRLNKEDFYLTASRLVPYKRIPLIVEAFARMSDKRLVVIGDGPEMAAVRAKATPNVTILGYQPDSVLADHLKRAKAFVFAAEEDFGIVPVEAQACGTPVIAFGRGGALETVIGSGEGQTGIFFDRQDAESLCLGVKQFEEECARITPESCRRNAERFSAERFRHAMRGLVEEAWRGHQGTLSAQEVE